MRRWLREPLVQFLIGGFAIFLFSAWRGEAVDPASRTIVIDEAQVRQITANFSQTWQRPPSQVEIDGLIRDHIREEVYYREALRLGLDQDDALIRRRLRSKMEFLAQSQVESETPSDATLQAWLDRNPARYASGARYSFDQIYLGGADGDDVSPRAREVQAALAKGGDWHSLALPLSVPPSLERADRAGVAAEFGDEFADALPRLSRNGWAGPLASGFGMHLVRLRAVEVPDAPQLADVRREVENDWRAATAKSREERAFRALLDAYTIKIAAP